MLSPLINSEYTVNNNLEFINYMNTISIPSDHKLDVKSLFTNVPLDFTIDLILKCIHEDIEIQTNIKKKEMKQLLLLCTKTVHFSYNGTIYQQRDGVAMGSPLGAVLAGIFVVHLERTLIPKLTEHMNPRKRYVDDTISIINPFVPNAPFLYSPINLLHIFRTPFPKNTSGGLLLFDNNPVMTTSGFKRTVQKQSPEGVLLNTCSYKFCKIHKKNTCTRVSFWKLQRRCFPMNFATFLRITTL